MSSASSTLPTPTTPVNHHPKMSSSRRPSAQMAMPTHSSIPLPPPEFLAAYHNWFTTVMRNNATMNQSEGMAPGAPGASPNKRRWSSVDQPGSSSSQMQTPPFPLPQIPRFPIPIIQIPIPPPGPIPNVCKSGKSMSTLEPVPAITRQKKLKVDTNVSTEFSSVSDNAGEKVHTCATCGKSYKNLGSMNKHEFEHHPMWAECKSLVSTTLTRHQRHLMIEAATILMDFKAESPSSSVVSQDRRSSHFMRA